MPPSDTLTKPPQVSVVIPARNEEASLSSCLESLVSQTGVDFEIIVVNDQSTDRTREIAASFAGVCVIDADPLPAGWTGKNNAVSTGVRSARGLWLLFTDADTVHLPGSLARALAEAQQHKADMLSYSPEQIAVTFWERSILPVVFAELARQYPPSKVSDPNSPEAAANGQYILVNREAYDAVGGHAALAASILEDVALARAFKASGRKIRFRYAADAVRTRMYRNFHQLREGWTKNLVLLFPNPGWVATRTLLWWLFPVGNALVPFEWPGVVHRWWWFLPGSFVFSLNTMRLRRANFDVAMEFLGAFFGMPMFAYLLLRSKRAHAKGDVFWKGRNYGGKNSTHEVPIPNPSRKTLMKTTLILILPTLLIASAASSSSFGAEPATRSAAQSDSTRFLVTLIDPGLAVGQLKLGDSRERALELFPKKGEDQEWEDDCGTTLDWVDTSNPMGRGDVFIRLNKKGKIFQIESSTTRFHTAEDITTFDPPEKVRNVYKDLKAFVLLTPPSPALGDRPLVFWIDKRKGLAFVFAYDPSRRKRYVYKIVVFEPNKEFCPEQEKTSSPKWQSISPYAIEPPPELSPELR